MEKTKMSYIVMTARAPMPSSCWGKYGRVAVIEMDDDWLAVERMRAMLQGRRPPIRPAMISERARGVVRVVATWERLNIGRTARCAFDRAGEEAYRLAGRLNAEAAHAEWSGRLHLDRDF
jgi:hypothetical protein